MRELEILHKSEFGGVKQRYFALRRGDEGVEISQADDVSGVDPLILLDEELLQSGRFMEEYMQ